MGWPGWGMGGGGWFGMILFWVLAILAIVWLVRNLGLGGLGRDRKDGQVSQPAAEDRALSTLRERYARGEIDSDEFERRKRDLTGPT